FAALPANLAALPAVAPVMWTGMLAAAAGQLPGFLPADWMATALGWLAGVGAGYIAAVARWCAAPQWAQVDFSVGAAAAVVLAISLAVLMHGGIRSATALTGQRPRIPGRVATIALVVTVIAAVALWLAGR